MQEFFELGQIVNVFGIKGFVKVVAYTEDISRFKQLDKVFLVKNEIKKEYEIEEVKYHKNFVLIKFKNINTVEEAETLRNYYIQVKRETLGEPDEGTYYIADLIGIDVYSDEGKFLGILEDIYNTGSNDIYVVREKNGKQILLPAINDVIKEINITDKKILVHLINGL